MTEASRSLARRLLLSFDNLLLIYVFTMGVHYAMVLKIEEKCGGNGNVKKRSHNA